jgi:prepilin-type processing-associated H-X9-DG protein/prepilin-type N-terminal cleavage/methylation domain-containing protein
MRRGLQISRLHHLSSIRAVSADQCPAGFTLVELLVVIGIIAVLVGLLMPALSAARQAAQRVACSAKLHQIVVAAQLHANDHHGYYPLAGALPGFQPGDFDDAYSTKYSYTSYDVGFGPSMIAPITVALSAEMSYHNGLFAKGNDQIGNAETDPNGFIRNFLCPSQATTILDINQFSMLYESSAVAYTEQESYIFNEAVLGWGDEDIYNRLKGEASMVRQPARTMFAADGLIGQVGEERIPNISQYWPWGMATLYNIAVEPPVTMADALVGEDVPNPVAGDWEDFDTVRHRNKINVAFCDGHVEIRNITVADLSSVFLLAP